MVLLPVIAVTGTAESDLRSVRGLVKPVNQAIMSSEISGRIDQIPYREGESFKAGDTLLAFDCSLYRAQLAAAEAVLQARTREYENAEELLTYKANSPIEVEIAQSEMKQAAAKFDIESFRVKGCLIEAPYSGRVAEVFSNEHESVAIGADLIAILSDEGMEIELIVPSTWLGWLEVEEPFEFTVDETGETYPAAVTRIGAMVDPVSQTVRLVGEFRDGVDEVLSGMSGNARFAGEP